MRAPEEDRRPTGTRGARLGESPSVSRSSRERRQSRGHDETRRAPGGPPAPRSGSREDGRSDDGVHKTGREDPGPRRRSGRPRTIARGLASSGGTCRAGRPTERSREIERRDFAARPDDREAASAQIPGLRLDDGERQRDGDRRIDSIPPCGEPSGRPRTLPVLPTRSRLPSRSHTPFRPLPFAAAAGAVAVTTTRHTGG